MNDNQQFFKKRLSNLSRQVNEAFISQNDYFRHSEAKNKGDFTQGKCDNRKEII